MNKKLLLTLLVVVGTFFNSSASSADINLQANFYYVPFLSPETGPYLETYLTIMGNTAKYVEADNGKMQASIEITYIFRQYDEIVEFSKTSLKSPIINKGDSIFPNFMDVSRIPIKNGIYELEVKVKDLNKDTVPFTTKAMVNINFPETIASFSGIEWVEESKPSTEESVLSKSGLKVVPYVSNFFPQNVDEMKFYLEIYNLDKLQAVGDQLLFKYYINSAATKLNLNAFTRSQKIPVENVQVVLGKLNIKNLPSGNFDLVVEVVNRNNEVLLTNSSFFQRSNPGVNFSLVDVAALDVTSTFVSKITNIDTMRYYLDALYPISTQSEETYAQNLIKTDDILKMQQFFYNFWIAKNPSNPESEWLFYKRVLNDVNRNYSTQVRKGYQTDRGRVFLQYGAPNAFVQEKNFPDTYPFEIWQYYELDGFQNVRFLFYNPHKNYNTYELLHSTHRLELQNDNWLVQMLDYHNPVSTTQNIGDDIDDIKMRIVTLWNNP